MTSSRRLRTGRVRLGLTVALVAFIVGALAMPGAASAATCDDFSTQQEAQNFFDNNRTANANLDTNRNGIACENLSGSASPVLAQTGFPAWIFLAGALVFAAGALALRRRPSRT